MFLIYTVLCALIYTPTLITSQVQLLKDGPSRGAQQRAPTRTEEDEAAAGSGPTWVQFTLKEGRNRQIRRMVHALGYTVKALHRSSFCGVQATGLRVGKWAYLTPEELQLLRKRR